MSGRQIRDIITESNKRWRVTFIICMTISILLIIVSFIIPPHGVVDSSVLAAVGEIFTFPALYSVYNIFLTGRAVTFKKGDMEISANAVEKEQSANS